MSVTLKEALSSWTDVPEEYSAIVRCIRQWEDAVLSTKTPLRVVFDSSRELTLEVALRRALPRADREDINRFCGEFWGRVFANYKDALPERVRPRASIIEGSIEIMETLCALSEDRGLDWLKNENPQFLLFHGRSVYGHAASVLLLLSIDRHVGFAIVWYTYQCQPVAHNVYTNDGHGAIHYLSEASGILYENARDEFSVLFSTVHKPDIEGIPYLDIPYTGGIFSIGQQPGFFAVAHNMVAKVCLPVIYETEVTEVPQGELLCEYCGLIHDSSESCQRPLLSLSIQSRIVDKFIKGRDIETACKQRLVSSLTNVGFVVSIA